MFVLIEFCVDQVSGGIETNPRYVADEYRTLMRYVNQMLVSESDSVEWDRRKNAAWFGTPRIDARWWIIKEVRKIEKEV